MDNAQITTQLAQLSTVTGIEKLNTTLQTLLQNSQDSQTTQAAALVGQAVMVPGSALTLSKGAAVGGFELASDAELEAMHAAGVRGVRFNFVKRLVDFRSP